MFDKNASSFNQTYSIHIFLFYHDIHLKKVKMVILQTHIYKKKKHRKYIFWCHMRIWLWECTMVWCYLSNPHKQWGCCQGRRCWRFVFQSWFAVLSALFVLQPRDISFEPPPTPPTMWNNIMPIVLLLLRTVIVLFILCSYHSALLLCQREQEIQFFISKSYGWIKQNNNHHSQLFLLVHYLYYIHFNQKPPSPHVKTLRHYYNMQCWLLHSQSTLSVGGWWCFFFAVPQGNSLLGSKTFIRHMVWLRPFRLSL